MPRTRTATSLSVVAISLISTAAILAAAWLSIGSASVRAANQAVTIASFAFSPADLTVAVGDTVTWTNRDGPAHTVTTSSGPVPISSGDIQTDGTFSFTFGTAGTYEYFCTPHPNMTARVTVTAAAAPAPPAATAAPAATPAPGSAATGGAPDTATEPPAGTSTSAVVVFLGAALMLLGVGALAPRRSR